MTPRFLILTVALAFVSSVYAQCGAGNPDARVTGSGNSFVATRGSSTVYSGSDYRAAIQAAIDSIGWGQRVSVMASGSIGASTITIQSGKIFEGCGTINVGNRGGRGAIEVTNASDVKIPYLSMTGNPYFGLRFFGTRNLSLGQITMNLSGGLGIRFDRDQAANSNVSMDVINITGAGSHAVETWNIDGLTINQVIARNVGECGLLLQRTTNARVGLVDGTNVATGNGYATFRMANNNGQLPNGSYNTNVYVNRVVSRGGGRGIFCVSQSGGATIESVDLSNNGNNAILLENCYNVRINGGTVNGGGEVRVAARSEFPNNRDMWITLRVDNTSVREQPCGQNINWNLSGNGRRQLC
ncbi:ricin B lectin [Coprinopsis cinerea okayama7|uniref:Ricin B lectin n=1 Tax=Coprinopsis cinerea (strain Okayama-7 / 130 / ATCC MYA-4618 / FGSC 9003) TaxID=240176 RepID=A8NLP8_COPC7|nr:ricin B lectin [Coprinopsis cinerea okayama7\|eukprot:XP_001834747.1 ricin B lectin [Coprinopsis cinerea okayama7\